MNLTLRRSTYTPESTIGELFVNGSFECYTLEDTVRELGVKVPGKTAIPKGRYEVVVTFSNRFKRLLPLLLNVLMFEGVRMHPGNKAVDTEGCILVGVEKHENMISRSREAFDILFHKIQDALTVEKVFIEVA